MILIQNIYYMLSYAFNVLNEHGYKKILTEEFDNVAELMAAILIKGISFQIRRGLDKNYILKTEPVSFPKGKIDISESVKTQSFVKKKIICSYDDFSINGQMNQILKSTITLLLKLDISKERKKKLRELLIYFEEVNLIDLYTLNWNIRYNSCNQSYQMLISICYLVVKGLLQTNTDGTTKLMDYIDEKQMCRLYEKFVFEYYRKHFPKYVVTSSKILWSVDDNIVEMLPEMRSDVMLTKGKDVLIIDAKFYSRNIQTFYGTPKIHSHNLYQIFTYVKNKDAEFNDEDHTVSGMLLYATTNDAIQPNNTYQMSGNKISVRTLDLNTDFTQISKQLNDIVKEHFKD